ncbi:MAG: PAS domain S-box protein [Methylococcales bacterium]|nr:PAS domain S-box protein [Methylococcales bacterium]
MDLYWQTFGRVTHPAYFRFGVLGQRKDGHLFAVEMTISEMWLGGQRYFTCILRDITARKRAEEELIKAGALQSAMFNSANFLSIATDEKGVIQIFNVGAERMLGYTAAEVMNKITPADISDPLELIIRAEVLTLELENTYYLRFRSLSIQSLAAHRRYLRTYLYS